MIRSICLNPVVDRMYYIDDFTEARQYKEIPPRVYPGGKGVNIARVVSQLGGEACLYAFLGGNNGLLISDDMRRHGVLVRDFALDGETRTTINIIDENRRRETEITEPSVPVHPHQEREFLSQLESDLLPGDLVVCSGIPCKGMSQGIYRAISVLCEQANAHCVLDTNNNYLRESFPARYFSMKPNFAELLELHQEHMECSPAAIQTLGEKTLACGVENLLVSTGKTGGIFISKDVMLEASVPQVQVKSTIGSGDASVAGYCVAVARGLSAADRLRLAMACGVCNAMFSEVGFVDAALVEELCGQIAIRDLGGL